MLFLLLACASTAEKADTADATGGSSLGGGETADDTQSDTDPVDDTGGDADFTHYMSVTAGYPADGRLMGFCACASDDDRLVLTGFIEATVTEGQIVGSWAAEDGDQSLSATVQGALDATTLHATLSGNADWIAFTGEVDGTYP
jgi:hypothetical protein